MEVYLSEDPYWTQAGSHVFCGKDTSITEKLFLFRGEISFP